MGALTGSSELSGNNLVNQRDVSLDVFSGNTEEFNRSLDGTGGLALGVRQPISITYPGLDTDK